VPSSAAPSSLTAFATSGAVRDRGTISAQEAGPQKVHSAKPPGFLDARARLPAVGDWVRSRSGMEGMACSRADALGRERR
jgi:hypothetical protein